MNISASNLLNDFDREISSLTGNYERDISSFSVCRSVLRRCNAVLLHESFVQSDSLDL